MVTPHDLSGPVESLLKDFTPHERVRRRSEVKLARAATSMWNHFDEEFSSFADQHSPL